MDNLPDEELNNFSNGMPIRNYIRSWMQEDGKDAGAWIKSLPEGAKKDRLMKLYNDR